MLAQEIEDLPAREGEYGQAGNEVDAPHQARADAVAQGAGAGGEDQPPGGGAEEDAQGDEAGGGVGG